MGGFFANILLLRSAVCIWWGGCRSCVALPLSAVSLCGWVYKIWLNNLQNGVKIEIKERRKKERKEARKKGRKQEKKRSDATRDLKLHILSTTTLCVPFTTIVTTAHVRLMFPPCHLYTDLFSVFGAAAVDAPKTTTTPPKRSPRTTTWTGDVPNELNCPTHAEDMCIDLPNTIMRVFRLSADQLEYRRHVVNVARDVVMFADTLPNANNLKGTRSQIWVLDTNVALLPRDKQHNFERTRQRNKADNRHRTNI